MALIEAVFRRGADDRTMSFQTISEETRLPSIEVEHLVMKALSYVPSLLRPSKKE
jgi:26S proteasome regulatory subunit N9